MAYGHDFGTRLRKALALMEDKGIRRSTYAPPLFQLLWKLGVKAPPPLMAGFGFNALVMGGFFGLFWGLIMWGLMWSRQGMPGVLAAGVALMAGLLFGTIMAWYLRRLGRRHGIPAWGDFGG